MNAETHDADLSPVRVKIRNSIAAEAFAFEAGQCVDVAPALAAQLLAGANAELAPDEPLTPTVRCWSCGALQQ